MAMPLTGIGAEALPRLNGRDGLAGNRFTLEQLEHIALDDHAYHADMLM